MKPVPKLSGIRNASVLYTGKGIRAKDGRRVTEEDLGEISGGAMIYEETPSGSAGKILWIGKNEEIPKATELFGENFAAIEWQDLQGKRALMPGMTDCHTHLVFAGSRASEFARRCAGTTYAEIAREGGGILTTVRATREASFDELYMLGAERLRRSLLFGVRAIEIKSGYGLSLVSELKVLRVIQKLKADFPGVLIQSTFLGAHDFPRETARADYVRMLIEEALPQIVSEKLADACDVFIDEAFYTVDEGRKILEKAGSLGLKTKVHADELANTESAAFAAEIGALSADHLLKISDESIATLAKSSTVAVLLPGTAFYLKAEHAPARKLLKAGAKVAISTDFNPGTCFSLNLPFMLTVSALYQGMSKAELFAAVTYNAASALGFEKEIGTLEVGMPARFTVLDVPSFEELYYRFG